MRNFLFFILLSLVLHSCIKDSITQSEQKYLHISHTRGEVNPVVDSIAERINYDKYDLLLLGGDLALLSSENVATMNHLDSIFNFGSINTLWTMGNHDYTDVDLVQDYTNRPLFYAYYNKGITFIVFDTQFDSSNISFEQLNLFNSVVDTISQSSHLILMTHKLIWMYGDENLESQVPEVSNAPIGDCSFCINPNNFYSAIYPALVDVKSRDIEVICLAGDIGKIANEFQHTTLDGIFFLASGIEADSTGNKGLVFNHFPDLRQLSWEFKPIEEL